MFFLNTGKFYKPHFERVTMIEALKTCQAEGGQLTEYHSQAEYEAALAMHSMLKWFKSLSASILIKIFSSAVEGLFGNLVLSTPSF